MSIAKFVNNLSVRKGILSTTRSIYNSIQQLVQARESLNIPLNYEVEFKVLSSNNLFGSISSMHPTLIPKVFGSLLLKL